MEKHIPVLKKMFILFVATALTYSCSDEENQFEEDSFALNSDDIQTVLETDAIVGAADNLLTTLFTQDGVSGKSLANDECYTREDTDMGYRLTFVTCQLDGKDVSGEIEVVYNLNGDMPTFTATYTDLFVDGIALNGTRTYLFDGETNGSNLSFSVTSDMDLVLADGSIANENGTRFFGFSIGNTLADTAVTLTGDWNLTVGEDTYTATVIELLKTKLSCDYISEGQLSLDKNGLAVMVDFGDGTCDAVGTITYPDGTVQRISLDD